MRGPATLGEMASGTSGDFRGNKDGFARPVTFINAYTPRGSACFAADA